MLPLDGPLCSFLRLSAISSRHIGRSLGHRKHSLTVGESIEWSPVETNQAIWWFASDRVRPSLHALSIPPQGKDLQLLLCPRNFLQNISRSESMVFKVKTARHHANSSRLRQDTASAPDFYSGCPMRQCSLAFNTYYYQMPTPEIVSAARVCVLQSIIGPGIMYGVLILNPATPVGAAPRNIKTCLPRNVPTGLSTLIRKKSTWAPYAGTSALGLAPLESFRVRNLHGFGAICLYSSALGNAPARQQQERELALIFTQRFVTPGSSLLRFWR